MLLAAQGKARQGQGGRLWRRCSTWRRGEARKRRVARLRAASTIGARAIEDALPDEKIYGASWDDPEPYYSALTGWRTTSRPSCPSSVLVGGCKSSAPWRRAAAKRRHSRRYSAQLPAASGLSCNRSHLLVMRTTSMGLKLLQPLLLLPVRFLPEGGLCPRASHTCAVPELLVLASPTRTAGTRVRRRRRKATRIAGHRQHVFVDGIQRSEWTRGTCSSGRSWRRCSTWRRGEARRRRVARLRAVIVDVLVAIGARTIGACAIEDALPDEKIYGASWDDPEPYYSALTGWRTTSRPSCPSSVLVGGCKSSAPWRRAAAKRRHSRRYSAQLPAASGLSCNRSHLLVMRTTSMGLKLLQPLLLLPVRFLPEGKFLMKYSDPPPFPGSGPGGTLM